MATIDRDKLGEYLSAYLDGELSDAEREAVDRLVARDARARAQLEELRQTVEVVRALPKRAAPPSLMEDLSAALERRQLLGEPADEMPIRRPWWVSLRPVVSMAAVFAIAVGGGLIVYRSMTEPVRGPMVADSGLPVVEEAPAAAAPAESEEKLLALGEAPAGRPPGERGNAPADAVPAARGRGRMVAEAPGGGGRGGGAKGARPKGEMADRLAGADRELETLRALGYVSGDAEATVPAPSDAVSNLGVAEGRGEPVLADASAPRFRRLVAGLTLEQKNEAKLDGEALARHSFANESNVLAVVVKDSDDELLAQQQLAVFATEKHFRKVLLGPDTPALSNDEPLYVEGRPGYNYHSAEPAQVLVRVPASGVPDLVERVSTNPSGRRRVRMKVGPLVADGLAETERVVAQMQRPGRYGVLKDAYAMAPSDRDGAAERRADKKGKVDAESVTSRVSVSGAVEGAGPPAAPEAKEPADRLEEASKARLGLAGKASEGGGASATVEGEPADESDEVHEGFGTVISRLVGGEVDVEGEEATEIEIGAGEPKDAEEALDVEPGQLVPRNLDALRRRPSEPDDTATALYYDDRREKGKAVERLITLVVQFQRPPALTKPATQPAGVEVPAEGAGAPGGE
ncbi:MAG TPA: hypothetical protein VM243_15210 [Phycisphaerae bacterium]|nr:hypothetical protein [Phycisphaerae bacterium]